ncbi:MAG TPA: tetratricopeptide repeat protein [Armatimonadota bacterium]|jgi:tetratricopeptide (TPR) repeat protein
MQKWLWRMVVVALLATLASVALADVRVDFRVELGRFRHRGDYDGGIARCGAFIRDNPRYYDGYVERARCYMELREYEPCRDDLLFALRLEPDRPEILVLLGECYQDLGDEAEATYYFNRCRDRAQVLIRLNDRDYDDDYWYGRCSYDLDDFDVAIEYCNRALIIEPNFFDCLFFRGDIFFQERHEDFAIADYDRCLGYDPDAVIVLNRRARCFVERGDWANADRDLRRCEQVNPRFAPQFYTRGLWHERQGHLEDAQRAYTQSVQLNPRLPQPYLRRGTVLQKLGRNDQAQQDLGRAAQLDQGNVAARQQRLNRMQQEGRLGTDNRAPVGQGGPPPPTGAGRGAPPPSGRHGVPPPPSGGQGGPPPPIVRANPPLSPHQVETAPTRSERPRGYVAREARNAENPPRGGANPRAGGAGAQGGQPRGQGGNRGGNDRNRGNDGNRQGD